jgi:hypothetical protein
MAWDASQDSKYQMLLGGERNVYGNDPLASRKQDFWRIFKEEYRAAAEGKSQSQGEAAGGDVLRAVDFSGFDSAERSLSKITEKRVAAEKAAAEKAAAEKAAAEKAAADKAAVENNARKISDYASLMRREQEDARQHYNYDPRVTMANTRGFSNVDAANAQGPPNLGRVDPSEYTDIPQGSRSDPSIVQASPQTRAFKRYVIIDASQRDWVKQPNPYSNVTFSFGSQAVSPSNPAVYENNSFVPTFALEQSFLPAPVPGVPNVTGWTLAAGSSNTKYPPYNSSLPRGNFIANDTGYVIQPSGSGFGSVFTPCNVQSIRLVRAVLPQKQFLNIPIDPSTNSVDGQTSLSIQSNLIGKPYSTFTTYSYLMLYLNEYFGQYVGGNEPVRRSFSVMTQKQRQQTNFQTDVGVQQFDYEPWGAEALHLQSPITNLQKLAITVTDPVGNIFSQNDTLSITLIQATADSMYLKCFTPNFSYFSSNDLRVGDRILFYSNTMNDMLKSPVLQAISSTNPQKRDFILALSTATFPVLQLLDYVQDSNFVFIPRDVSGGPTARTKPYISSYNGFLIPNFVNIGANGDAIPSYPQAIDPVTSNVLEPNTLVGSNLAFLNSSLQPVYTLELETLQPDTANLGGKIVM